MSAIAPPAEWYGSSGQSYGFAVFPYAAKLPPIAGCYIIVRRTEAGRLVPIFIGETSDFSRLSEGHPQAMCIAAAGPTHIHIHENGNAVSRFSELADLLDHWDPACNPQAVRVI